MFKHLAFQKSVYQTSHNLFTFLVFQNGWDIHPHPPYLLILLLPAGLPPAKTSTRVVTTRRIVFRFATSIPKELYDVFSQCKDRFYIYSPYASEIPKCLFIYKFLTSVKPLDKSQSLCEQNNRKNKIRCFYLLIIVTYRTFVWQKRYI